MWEEEIRGGTNDSVGHLRPFRRAVGVTQGSCPHIHLPSFYGLSRTIDRIALESLTIRYEYPERINQRNRILRFNLKRSHEGLYMGHRGEMLRYVWGHQERLIYLVLCFRQSRS